MGRRPSSARSSSRTLHITSLSGEEVHAHWGAWNIALTWQEGVRTPGTLEAWKRNHADWSTTWGAYIRFGGLDDLDRYPVTADDLRSSAPKGLVAALNEVALGWRCEHPAEGDALGSLLGRKGAE